MNIKDVRTVILALGLLLTASVLLALEVPQFTSAQREFLAMSAAARRANFTNEAYRAALVRKESEVVWREAVSNETTRFRHLPGVPNMRDLGGLVGLDGKAVVTGLVYRSAGLNNNACRLYKEAEVRAMWKEGTLVSSVPPESRAAAEKIKNALDKGKKTDMTHLVRTWCPGKERLTDEARALQVRRFGIRTDLDLRTNRECFGMKGSPLGPQTRFAHISSKAYASFHSEEGRAAFKQCFAIFLEEANYPIVFHCIAGADRTGSLAYTLEALLGVSDDDLLLDWELTAFDNPNVRFSHRERYDRLLAGFEKFPGATARERAEALVKSLGFTDADIAKFRAIMFGELSVRR